MTKNKKAMQREPVSEEILEEIKQYYIIDGFDMLTYDGYKAYAKHKGLIAWKEWKWKERARPALRRWLGRKITELQQEEKRRKRRKKKVGAYKHGVYRETVYSRDGYKCVYCGSLNNLSLDHLMPVSRGGEDIPSNLVTCCRGCNSSKNAKTPEEWLASK